MREFVKKNSFKRDKIIHKDILGRAENDSHAGKSITIETQNITDKELTDVQKLASKLDAVNNLLPQITQNVSEASELASQASQAATTATESANAAGTLASQASQAAQEAAGIAAGAATTAGEAAQAINEHAQATTNPHATNVTQEFADTQITQLATEATYTPTVWSYLVGLFTTVPKSALQHIVKIWGVVNGLATRIGLLEDNYILKYVVPVDTNLPINLTTDKYGNAFNFVEGNSFSIIMKINDFVGNGRNRVNLRVNNISSPVYFNINAIITSFASAGDSYYREYFEFKFKVYDSELKGNVSAIIGSASTGWNSSQLYQLATIGANISAINSFQFNLSNSTYKIPAGTVILIKKI